MCLRLHNSGGCEHFVPSAELSQQKGAFTLMFVLHCVIDFATFPGSIMANGQNLSTGTRDDAAALLKHPETIDDFLLFRLYNLSRLAAHGVDLMLHREAGISKRDSRILAYMSRHPDVSLTQLAQIAGLDPVVTSRCVASLVARGLIAKTRLCSNKRLVVLTLTNLGRATYESARRAGQRYNIGFAACLSDEEATQLDLLLAKLEGQARELTEQEVSKTRCAEH
jgi:DNA-binding MarR family transcriptional regulator